MPEQWVPPFFVLTAECLDGSLTDEELVARLDAALSSCRVLTKSVIIRSNGQDETIRDRGRFVSRSCDRANILVAIRQLNESVTRSTSRVVHWIIQALVEERLKGQLSNERRLKLERRDWVAEIEPTSAQPGYQSSIAVRGWRDGKVATDLNLECTSETQITLRLKRVAMWAMTFSTRLLFEWVWDGASLYIVQADIADPIGGVQPKELLPTSVANISPTDLVAFGSAQPIHYQTFAKLRNARIYNDLGYTMPEFYVLDRQDMIRSLLSGIVSAELEADLEKLTRRPLILRTDGVSLPGDKCDMLPRSEELRSLESAKAWLLGTFGPKIREMGIETLNLCLIAHHFIPSVASAWARSEPGKRWVRIESLWGIPEGLYWYSHDTFEVDTAGANLAAPLASGAKYHFRERLRFKGTFIAPDEVGAWVNHQPMSPQDWGRSVTNSDWLSEIAHTTRRIAENAQVPVSVMWFIDNHPQATRHRVLPWYHSSLPLDQAPKAAPRNKVKSALDCRIESSHDWISFKDTLLAGTRIERVTVHPIDPQLIRSQVFAEELASLAAQNNVAVVLAGGILSHAYHALRRYGARVECIDLFGAEEEIVEYNKIVRDKVPAKIQQGGERVETIQLTGEALITALRRKLVEEALEALDAKPGEELVGELADVEEVLRALAASLAVTREQMERERKDKTRKRGGFDQGYMLVKTATPHSLQKWSPVASLGLTALPVSTPTISASAALPAKPRYRRPDLRNVDQQAEKVFTFETELNQIGAVSESATFQMPIEAETHGFTLSLEIRRNRSLIRGIVKLRSGSKQKDVVDPSTQPELPFDQKQL